jgi:hypothetical protein
MQNERKYADDLMRDYPSLTEYEALTLAIGMRKNDILKSAFMVNSDNDYPVAFEAIAMALGFDNARGSGNIAKSIDSIADSISSLSEAISDLKNNE